MAINTWINISLSLSLIKLDWFMFVDSKSLLQFADWLDFNIIRIFYINTSNIITDRLCYSSDVISTKIILYISTDQLWKKLVHVHLVLLLTTAQKRKTILHEKVFLHWRTPHVHSIFLLFLILTVEFFSRPEIGHD